MKRMSALVALGIAACASGARGPEAPLRVLVYNIHAGKDAGRVENLERVAEIVKDSRADIVLLQEVDNRTRRSGGVDQTARLRELTKYSGVFGRTIDYDGGEFGIAILSRWPISSWKLTHLPVDIADEKARARYEDRGGLVAVVEAPGGRVRVVDTHLDAYSDSNRVQQARTLIAIAGAQKDSGFTILGGDLNSEPASKVVSALRDSGWRDVFADCGKGERFTFPADVPIKRIDYLLLSGAATCVTASVLDTRASDHRPVLFEISK
jgi:endonuclease/exonuclease/phosphatase family metal-dependent hydrolase